jgi:glycogen debranching enzyme
MVYEDGREVEPPLAACELQGYWYFAQLLMAEVLFTLGERGEAKKLYDAAQDLKKRFNERFWMPQEKFIALALDRDKRQVKTIASNAGHCLATGIIDDEFVPDVARRLMVPDLFSGWGVRTVSSDHPLYNPFGYHLGAVWPVENATIAIGLKRYGFDDECNRIAKGIFDAAGLFPHYRLPEALGGHSRDERHPHPGMFPESEAPQAWSASAVAWLIQALLGVWTFAPLKILFLNPVLPAWLPELTLRNVRVKDAHVSIRFWREDDKTEFKVLEKQGSLHVIRQPFPGDLDASFWERVRDVVGSLPNL